MPDESERDTIDSYGKTGPYGETLWFLLGLCKSQFLSSLISDWLRDYGSAKALQQLNRLLVMRIERAIEIHNCTRTHQIEVISACWPEQATRNCNRKKLAEQRCQELELYLFACLELANDLSPQNITDLSRKSYSPRTRKPQRVRKRVTNKLPKVPSPKQLIARAVGGLLWPYYFIHHKNKVITWMPNVNLLRLPYTDSLSPKTDSIADPGVLLYPSLYGLVGNPREKDAELFNNLEKWMDIGKSNLTTVVGASTEKTNKTTRVDRAAMGSRDIGHIQPFPGGPSSLYIADIRNQEYRKRSRFSDFFFLNRAGYRWYDYHKGSVCGILYWCTPLETLLLDFMDIENPIDGDIEEISEEQESKYIERVARLRHLTEEAWLSCHGPTLSNVLRKRYKTTEEELLQQRELEMAREAHRRIANSLFFIRHSLKNTLDRGITLDTPPQQIRRFLTLERITINAAGAMSDKQFLEPLLWSNAGCNRESIGRTIEAAMSSPNYEIIIDDQAIYNNFIDPRLAGIIAELARNLSKHHSHEESNGKIVLSQKHRLVNIKLNTYCAADDAYSLANRLRLSTLKDSSGVNLISKLFASIDGLQKRISWSFSYADPTLTEKMCTIAMKDSKVAIRGPASIFDISATPKQDSLRMEFRAEGLKVILG